MTLQAALSKLGRVSPSLQTTKSPPLPALQPAAKARKKLKLHKCAESLSNSLGAAAVSSFAKDSPTAGIASRPGKLANESSHVIFF